jgi:hypothetical protein
LRIPLSASIEGETSQKYLGFIPPSLFIEKGNLSITRTGNWRKGMSVIEGELEEGDEVKIRTNPPKSNLTPSPICPFGPN